MHVFDVGGDAEAATASMRTGPWNADGGGAPAYGALGVLADVGWGGAAMIFSPPEGWAITTELHLSFGAPLPVDGTLLHATSTAVLLGQNSALATGLIRTEHGDTVAAGTHRVRYVPGLPADHPVDPEQLRRCDGLGTDEMLGLTADADGGLMFTAQEVMSNPAGLLHGGILVCAAERAASRELGACNVGLAPCSVQTVFLRTGTLGDEIRCLTDVVYRGRTAATVTVRCVRPDGKECAFSTVDYGPVESSSAERVRRPDRRSLRLGSATR